MKKITLIIFTFLAFSAEVLIGQNAPISTVGNETSTGTSITVPITAINIINIGSCNLQLLYNPAVATCTGVSNGPGFPGGLAVNVATPGVITFGWYTWPGVTLPDNSVLFNLTFDKVAGGTSIIEWDDAYTGHQWSDGSSFPLNYLPFDNYHVDGSLTWQGDAPITIAPVLTACANTAIVIPITVKDFNTIGVTSLTLHFNDLVLTYLGFTNNSGFPGFFVFNPNPGVITAAGFVQPNNPGITLPDDAVLFTIHCTFLGGNTNLDWSDNGSSCEYGGPPNTYVTLNDTPTSTYYINGSISELCESQWTGNTDDDWFKSGNWTDGVPYVNKDAIIPDVNPNPFPILNANAVCDGMDIALDASVTVPASSTLTVYGDFNNDGQFSVESSPTGDGSFINYGAITGTGNSTVGRYLTSERWHYVSPPISNAVSGMFFDIYLKEWDESVVQVVPADGWTYIVPEDIDLNVMQGYGTWSDDGLLGTTTVFYDGSLNTGNINSAILTNTNGNASTGYNFVGNPYPSAVDWDILAGWTKTNLDNAIYIWNPAVGQYGSYIGGAITNDVTNIIPSGQGFYVHVSNGNATGSLAVNNDARLHDSKPFFKATSADNKLIKLEISSEINSYSDQTVIHFNEFATENFDPSFDAYDILAGLDEAPALYSVSAENANLSINTLPETENDISIPLMFSVGVNGIYTIEAVQIDNCENKFIYLKDLQENILTDFNSQAIYSFLGDVNDDPNRFELLILNSALGIEDFERANNLNIYSDKNIVYLISNENIFSGDLNIYDLAGKSVYKEQLQNSTNFEAVLNVEKGFYIVKLITKNTTITEKVFITK
ncbi:MAG: T9SS type A sorting domain-containing protein [Bacteroidales bacterium]|nr:T9SS type A sorting domain-containing protein [Bacteroidales bacterium]